MILGDFLNPILEGALPTFESDEPPRDMGLAAESTAKALAALERNRRNAAPGNPPEFQPQIALAVGGMLCRLSQFTVFREVPEEQIEAEFQAASSQIFVKNATASQIWSADVVLGNLLPDLYQIAKNLSENDPLMKPIRKLAKSWPLSGIGVDGVDWHPSGSDFDSVFSHETLGTLTVDRILDKEERTLAAIPNIRDRLDRAVGNYGKKLTPWLVDVKTVEQG